MGASVVAFKPMILCPNFVKRLATKISLVCRTTSCIYPWSQSRFKLGRRIYLGENMPPKTVQQLFNLKPEEVNALTVLSGLEGYRGGPW